MRFQFPEEIENTKFASRRGHHIQMIFIDHKSLTKVATIAACATSIPATHLIILEVTLASKIWRSFFVASCSSINPAIASACGDGGRPSLSN